MSSVGNARAIPLYYRKHLGRYGAMGMAFKSMPCRRCNFVISKNYKHVKKTIEPCFLFVCFKLLCRPGLLT
jgi:hypothetical protein